MCFCLFYYSCIQYVFALILPLIYNVYLAYIPDVHFQVNCGEFKSEKIFSINVNILHTHTLRHNYKLTVSIFSIYNIFKMRAWINWAITIIEGRFIMTVNVSVILIKNVRLSVYLVLSIRTSLCLSVSPSGCLSHCLVSKLSADIKWYRFILGV